MAFNRKQRLRDNIEAIRTAFLLDREQRTPTARERLLLERYCGFGGLKNILNPARELTDAVHWAKSDLELFAPTVELHRLLRENTKDETEYKRNMDAMKQSVLTAFYTPPEITEADLELDNEPSATSACFTLKSGDEERGRILRALKQAAGNKKMAAKILGIGRTTLYNKLVEYGLNEEN